MHFLKNESTDLLLFGAVPGLCCGAGFSLVAASGAGGLLSSCGAQASRGGARALAEGSSVVAAHGLSSYGSRAQ